MIKIAKRAYYDDKFEQSKNDLKATWKLINEDINKKCIKRSLPTTFNMNGRIISDPAEIANGFCNYFTNVGSTLASTIQTTTSAFQSFLGPTNNQTIFLGPTSIAELQDPNYRTLITGLSTLEKHLVVIKFLCILSKILLNLLLYH